MMTRKGSLIQSSVYCRAFTTGTHGEYLFLTLSNRQTCHSMYIYVKNIRVVGFVARSAPGQRRAVLLGLPHAHLSLEDGVYTGSLVDHIRHPRVPALVRRRCEDASVVIRTIRAQSGTCKQSALHTRAVCRRYSRVELLVLVVYPAGPHCTSVSID
jgi:hypothetical protein